MNKKIATIACLLAMGISTSFAQGVVIDTDATTGAISKIAIDNDANNMNWVLSPDGNVYYYYAMATGSEEYMDKVKEVVRNNLCNVFEDGTGSCAFVYPKRINGEQAHFADAFANDQDWALAFYLMINK